jgi:hypothetical protein
MNTTKIILISPVQGELDLVENTSVPLTFSVGDIRDLSKRKGTFSKTIQIANTNNNNILLNNYFDVNIAAGTFDVKKIAYCQVVENGVVVIDNATFQLISVTKVQNNSYSEHDIVYEAVIKDTVSDFFTIINNKELSDLNLGEFDHLFTPDNIIQSLSADSSTYGYTYFLPFKDNTNGVYNYDMRDFYPALYVKTYFDKIFTQAGYTYSFSGANDSDINFNKLIIPYNGDSLKETAQTLNDKKAIFEKNSFQLTGKTTIDNTTEIQDLGNRYNPTTGTYVNDVYIGGASVLQYQINVKYRVELTNTTGQIAYLPQTSPFAAANYVPKAQMFNGTFPVAGTNTNFVEDETEFQVLPNSSLAAGATLDLSNGQREAFITLGGQNFNPNQNFTLKLGFDGALSNQFITQQSTTNQALWRTGTTLSDPLLAGVYPTLYIDELEVNIVINLESLGFNSIIRMNNLLPSKVKQSDFIKSLFTMFNLYTIIDPLNQNNLIIKKRNAFYDEGLEVDWTEKLAVDREQLIEFLPDLSNKKIILTYKQDDNDPILKEYKIQTKENYGQYEYVFDSDFVKNTSNQEVIFSPIVSSVDNNNNVLPLILTPPKNNIKIGLKNGFKTLPEPIIKILNYFGDSTQFSLTTIIPLISHFNSEFTPTFDLNFGTNDFYLYQLSSLTNNNLFNLHWRRTFNQINNGKMFTAYFYLTESDINQLQLNQKIWVKDSWWNINQIIDYKAGASELTKVELISIDDELVLADANVDNNGTGWDIVSPGFPQPFTAADSTTGYVRLFNQDNNNNKNIILTNTPVLINGINNFISDNAGFSIVNGNNNLVENNSFVIGDNNITQNSSIVFGSNNIVDENANNIFVLGNGVTATTSDTLYVPNIILPSGGTINGVTVETIDFWITGTGTESIRRNNTTATIASGNFSYSEGIATTASNTGAHAEGFVTIASGINSHAEGRTTTASGDRAHSEGESTIASGARAHAEGFLTTAIGDESHAEGGSTIASGPQSHAEGNTTIASGDRAHSEGELTLASGDYSHAEGYATQASGIYSHAQGSQTVADGAYSHAEGNLTTALGFESHAGGFGSITQVDGEFARASYTTLAVLSQYGILHGINNTTNATADVIQFYVDHSLVNGYVLPTNTTMSFTYQVVARNTATGASRLITGEGLVKNISGTNTLVFGTSINNNGDAGLAGITAVPVLSTGAPTIQITGLAATNINWSGRIDYNLIGN